MNNINNVIPADINIMNEWYNKLGNIEKDVKKLNIRVNILEDENKELKAENKEIKAENKKIKAENKKLHKRIDILEAENKELKFNNKIIMNNLLDINIKNTQSHFITLFQDINNTCSLEKNFANIDNKINNDILYLRNKRNIENHIITYKYSNDINEKINDIKMINGFLIYIKNNSILQNLKNNKKIKFDNIILNVLSNNIVISEIEKEILNLMTEVGLTSLDNDECYEIYKNEYENIYKNLFSIVE